MSEENAATQAGEQGSADVSVHHARDLEREANRVISFLESSIPDFIRDAVVDALGEASEIRGLAYANFRQSGREGRGAREDARQPL